MSPYKMSKIEIPIRHALSFMDYLNKKDPKIIAATLSQDCTLSNLEHNGGTIAGYCGILAYLDGFFADNPDQNVTVTDAFNHPNRAIVKFKWRNLSANKDIIMQCVAIFEIAKERIISIDIYGKLS